MKFWQTAPTLHRESPDSETLLNANRFYGIWRLEEWGEELKMGVGEEGTYDISRILYFIDGINTAKKNSLSPPDPMSNVMAQPSIPKS